MSVSHTLERQYGTEGGAGSPPAAGWVGPSHLRPCAPRANSPRRPPQCPSATRAGAAPGARFAQSHTTRQVATPPSPCPHGERVPLCWAGRSPATGATCRDGRQSTRPARPTRPCAVRAGELAKAGHPLDWPHLRSSPPLFFTERLAPAAAPRRALLRSIQLTRPPRIPTCALCVTTASSAPLA